MRLFCPMSPISCRFRSIMLAAICCGGLVPAGIVLAADQTAEAIEASSPADVAPGLSLITDDSLAGWTYGAAEPQGWRVEDGRMYGAKGSTPLLSGWTMGDFELTLEWYVDRGGSLAVLLPTVPAGPELKFVLSERLAESAARSDPRDNFHLARLSRTGHQLTFSVNDHVISERRVGGEDRFGLGLAVVAETAVVRNIRLVEPTGMPIFNHKDLSGWWTPGDIKAWSAADNEITLTGPNGNYLRTDREYGNFVLSFEYLLKSHGNSGIGIRTARDGWPSGDGMELQLLDEPGLHKDSTMAIYGNLPPLARADESKVWNRAVVKADGRMISAWINGRLVQHGDTGALQELKHRHLRGWIGLQDHGDRVQFRKLNVLEAPDGLGLDAWAANRREGVAEALLDRLMNTERLTLPNDIQSGVMTGKVEEGKAGQFEFNLAGPGAIVQLPTTAGRWQFFFDDESKPRLECKTDELSAKLPALSYEGGPLVTFVPYERGLRIKFTTEPKTADFRIEYVHFPEGTKLTSFTDKQSALPRGWEEALHYRRDQFGWGTHREHDPWSKAATGRKELAPGESVTLELQGNAADKDAAASSAAGIVKWLKLDADRSVLADNDLWLEVSIDGKDIPEIDCPARFYFLPFGDNFPNYLVTDRGGPTNMLAMPYAAGLRAVLTNRGAAPLQAGLTASYEVMPAEQVKGRARLRGVFVSAKDAERKTVIRLGSPAKGQMIGIVLERSEDLAPDRKPLRFNVDKRSGLDMGLDDFGGPTGSASFRHVLGGQQRSLQWRFLLLNPLRYEPSIGVQGGIPDGTACLTLMYIRQE